MFHCSIRVEFGSSVAEGFEYFSTTFGKGDVEWAERTLPREAGRFLCEC
jgi:hypothetical protein